MPDIVLGPRSMPRMLSPARVSASKHRGILMHLTVKSTSLSWRATAGALAGSIVLVLLSACGNAAIGSSSLDPGSSPGAPASIAGVLPDLTRPTLTYDFGSTRLALPSPSYVPKISAEEAYQTWLSTGIYADAPKRSVYVGTKLALYTEYGRGSAGYSDTPVWVIAFTNFPESPGGGGHAPGEVVPTGPQVSLQDVLILISADTGKAIVAISTLPDVTPLSPPAIDTSPTKQPSRLTQRRRIWLARLD